MRGQKQGQVHAAHGQTNRIHTAFHFLGCVTLHHWLRPKASMKSAWFRVSSYHKLDRMQWDTKGLLLTASSCCISLPTLRIYHSNVGFKEDK